jgi:hypothetical protein
MAVTRLAFQLSEGDNIIDLAHALSMHQRTLIRQKRKFTILGGQIVDDTQSDQTSVKVTCSTLPNTWYVRSAINRCFRAWKNQRARTLANTENANGKVVVGKFADFKILYNGATGTSYVQPIATGTAGSRPVLAAGEWAYASVTDETAPAAGAEKHFQVLGTHGTTRYAALHGWLQTKPLPDTEAEPDFVDLNSDGVLDYKVDFLNNLNETDDGQPERMQLLYEDNDVAPYETRELYADADNSHNSQLQSMVYLSKANPSQMLVGFEALCGLVHLNVGNGSTSPILFLDVLNTSEAF